MQCGECVDAHSICVTVLRQLTQPVCACACVMICISTSDETTPSIHGAHVSSAICRIYCLTLYGKCSAPSPSLRTEWKGRQDEEGVCESDVGVVWGRDRECSDLNKNPVVECCKCLRSFVRRRWWRAGGGLRRCVCVWLWGYSDTCQYRSCDSPRGTLSSLLWKTFIHNAAKEFWINTVFSSFALNIKTTYTWSHHRYCSALAVHCL